MRRLIPLFLFFCLNLNVQSNAQEIEHKHSIYHSMLENKGQWHPNILFQAKFAGGNLWIQQNKFFFHLQDYRDLQEAHANFEFDGEPELKQHALHCNFLGSNKVTQIEKSGETDVYYNYFLGNNKSRWVGDVHGFSEVVLKEYYDGIDLKLIENELEMKYEFHVRPNQNPNQIRIEYVGQKKLSIDKEGNLKIQTALGDIIENKPYAFQIKNGRIQEVKCNFVLTEGVVTFELGGYDKNLELIIDPILIFATYAGSVTDNFGMTATYASDGAAFSAGTVYGNAYPTPDNLAYDINSNFTLPTGPTYGITDVFISKYSVNGTAMLWTTFLGGGDNNNGTETVHSLIADANDNLFCYGATSSADFPIQNGFQSIHGGGVANLNFFQNGVYFTGQGTDIYVAKISANGQNLMASTFIGGSGNDGVNYKVTSGTYNSAAAYDSLTKNYGDQFRGEVILDELGNCIVASSTRSSNFPTQNPFQATIGGNQDGVIFKLNSNLSSLIWSSYYGGSNNDACYSVKVDTNFNVVFSGGTSSTNLPGLNGWQTTYSGGTADGFVSRVSSNGQVLMHASYVGTSNNDQAFFVEIDRANKVFLVGQSQGGLFPVNNAAYANAGSSQFIIKLSSNLTTNLNSTVFGNGSPNINISPSAFLVDNCGNVYVSGWGANILQATPLTGMPVTPDALFGTSPNGFDFYLFVMDKTFGDIIYGSYIGGAQAQEHVDGGTSRFDKSGVVYQSVCGGCGGFSDFQTTPNAWSSSNLSTNCNNLIFKFDFQTVLEANFTLSDTAICIGETVTLTNNSSGSDSYYWILPSGTSTQFEPTLVFNTPGIFDMFLIVTDSVCNLTDTAQITVTVEPQVILNVSNDTVVCDVQTFELWANSFGTATYYVWSSDINFSDTLNDNPMDSTISVSSSGVNTYYVKVGNANCHAVDSVQIAIVDQSLSLVEEVSLCLGETPTVTVVNQTPSINFTYTWTPTSIIQGSNTGSSVVVNATASQYLFLLAQTTLGCDVLDSVWIDVHNLPLSSVFITVSPNDTVPQNAFVTLTANPSGYSYQWLPADQVTNPTSQVTQTQVGNEKEITLIVTDGVCTVSTKQKLFTYEFTCDEPYIFVPNAFSPNGDLQNDVLYVRSIVVEELIFRVFDRWGEMVFETTDLAKGWDGHFRGKLMDPDVYDYYFKGICVDGQEKIQKGNVTLLR
jgi:gliding motility-associated-like protein